MGIFVECFGELVRFLDLLCFVVWPGFVNLSRPSYDIERIQGDECGEFGFTLMDKLFGMLRRFITPEGVVLGCSGVSCLFNFSLLFLALSSKFSSHSIMLTCFLSPKIEDYMRVISLINFTHNNFSFVFLHYYFIL